jgi:hypothetical protein
MSKSIFCLLITAALSLASGCATSPKSGKGFTLPEGDAQAGKENFISLRCNACHQIDGVDHIPAKGWESEPSITLGGQVKPIETYGKLVTSIINPSHRLAKGYSVYAVSVDGRSKMKNYNDAMTVTQLIDLVALLQSKYKLLEYKATDYPIYGR